MEKTFEKKIVYTLDVIEPRGVTVINIGFSDRAYLQYETFFNLLELGFRDGSKVSIWPSILAP